MLEQEQAEEEREEEERAEDGEQETRERGGGIAQRHSATTVLPALHSNSARELAERPSGRLSRVCRAYCMHSTTAAKCGGGGGGGGEGGGEGGSGGGGGGGGGIELVVADQASLEVGTVSL